jgi:hypothetical protein
MMTGNDLMIRADSSMIEKVVVGGDLSPLTPAERLAYYRAVCESVGLNPLTKPFDYIRLNNKLVLYAKRDATDQLRDKRKVSVVILSREKVEDVYVVTAKATMPDGRTDESIGAVSVAGLRGDSLANAFMKAETKAKRRVTLSIVGLGWLDETEIETIPGVRVDVIDAETGEVKSVQPTQTPQPKEDSRPVKAEQPKPEPKPNGNGHGKKPAHPSAVYWGKVKELGIDKETAQGILANAGNDYDVALDRLTGHSQEPTPDDSLGFMEDEPVEA